MSNGSKRSSTTNLWAVFASAGQVVRYFLPHATQLHPQTYLEPNGYGFGRALAWT